MKILFGFIPCILLIFSSCKKSSTGDVKPPNNNEVKSTVVVSPSSTITINATGSKAKMGCSTSLGGGTYVEGTNEANAAVYVSVYASGFLCVTNPGTYGFSCQYRKNVADPNTPIYGTSGGSITFTAINGHHMEGSFTAVCTCLSQGNCISNVDSVVVTGTFKGDY